MREEERLYRLLRQVAPGTELREGVENVLHAGTGGLIVLGDGPEVRALAAGGFYIDCPYSAAALYELSKMDGAIILSSDARRIVLANVQLVPDPAVPSVETGIRHRSAERVSRQTGAVVIAVSQRRHQVTLFQGTLRHVLRDVAQVLGRANQALQALERQRIGLLSEISDLDAMEFSGEANLSDVCAAVQRFALLDRTAREVSGYVEELGTEGRMLAMQLQELTHPLSDEILYVVRDYAVDSSADFARGVREQLSAWSAEALLDLSAVARSMGRAGDLDQSVQPRGLRMLRRVPRLPPPVADRLSQRFGSLPRLLGASLEELDEVEGIGTARAHAIRRHLTRLREIAH